MSYRSQDLSLPEAEALREQVIKWRRTRRNHRGRMPEPLWAQAVELAQTHGVGPVARAVGLDYSGLKRKLERSEAASSAVESGVGTEPEVPAVPNEFIEMDPMGILSGMSGALVELERPDGCRVRVTLPAGTPPDWASLARSLFGGQRC
jgi:hypothetical protein